MGKLEGALTLVQHKDVECGGGCVLGCATHDKVDELRDVEEEGDWRKLVLVIQLSHNILREGEEQWHTQGAS